MDSKVWVGLGVVALAGATYYLTRPIDVDSPSDLSSKPSPKPVPKPVTKSPPPSHSQECHSPNCSHPSEPQPQSTAFLEFQDGVLTESSIAKIMAAIKDNYWVRMDEVSRKFKEERRKMGYENLQQYVEEIQKYRIAQNRTFDEVFVGTLQALSVDRGQIREFNEKFGPTFFYKQLASIAISTVKQPKDMSMTAAQAVELLEEKVELLTSLLPPPGQVSPEDLLINSFIVDDMLFSRHGIEDEEIVAQAQRFREDEGVKAVMTKLNALVPR